MEAISFSHENTLHSTKEVEQFVDELLKVNDYVDVGYYHSSLNGKNEKFVAKSFITDIFKTFNPDGPTSFARHIATRYSCYSLVQGKLGKYTIYKCDQNSEFYIYIRHQDEFVLIFTCQCEAMVRRK